MSRVRNQLYDLVAASLGQPFNLRALRAYQLARLNQSLRQTRQAPFYRMLLQDAPAQLHSLEELQRLPLTSAADLQARPLEDFLCLPPREMARVVSLLTSGSTGRPKRVAFTAADLQQTVRFFAWGMQEVTAPGQRVLICMPGERQFGISDLLAQGLRCLGAQPLHYGMIQDPADCWRVCREFRPHCLVGLPVQVLALSEYAAARGQACGIESVLLSADSLPQPLRQRIEAAWGCRVFNHYGTTEMNYGAALECCAHQGLHLRELDLYFEVINPATGRWQPPGVVGELVFSSLTRQGMPLLRYRTGDYAGWLVRDCACGSPLPRISPPRRAQGCQLTVAGRRLALQDLDELLFALPGLLDYQLRVQPGQRLLLRYWSAERHALSEQQCRACLAALLPAQTGWQLILEQAGAAEPVPGFLGKRLLVP